MRAAAPNHVMTLKNPQLTEKSHFGRKKDRKRKKLAINDLSTLEALDIVEGFSQPDSALSLTPNRTRGS